MAAGPGTGGGHRQSGGRHAYAIPEEFPGPRIRLKSVVDTLVCAIIKRLSYAGSTASPWWRGLALGIEPADLAGVEDVEGTRTGTCASPR